MKHIKHIIFILWLLVSIDIFAQNNIEATYIFESYGTYKTTGVLKIKEEKCHYSRKEENKTEKTDEGYEFYHYKDYIDWYYDMADKTIVQTRDTQKLPGLIARWQADMEWKITEEVGEIAGYKVQKAITTPLFEDSYPFIYGNAVAWFTTEIPVGVGPEGYYGLPGLIIKLEYSGMGVFSCTLKNLTFKEIEPLNLPINNGKVEVSKNKIYNLGNIDKKWFKKQKKQLKRND